MESLSQILRLDDVSDYYLKENRNSDSSDFTVSFVPHVLH